MAQKHRPAVRFSFNPDERNATRTTKKPAVFRSAGSLAGASLTQNGMSSSMSSKPLGAGAGRAAGAAAGRCAGAAGRE